MPVPDGNLVRDARATTAVLVDSSVWIDHLRTPDPELSSLLATDRVLCHPLVVGELACGNFARRPEVLEFLDELRTVRVAELSEVRELIEVRHTHGRGVGLLDTWLLASALIDERATLWTRDRRLHALAVECDVDWKR